MAYWLDDNPSAQYQQLGAISTGGPTVHPEPGMLAGMGSSLLTGVGSIFAEVRGIATEGLASAAKETGLFNQEWLDQQKQKSKWMIREMQPDPMTTGLAGNIVHGFVNIGGEAVIGGFMAGPIGAAATVGVLQGYKETTLLEMQGVDKATSTVAGVTKGLSLAAAVALPVAMRGYGMLYNFGIGAAGNVATGAVDRLATRKILEREYPEMAKHYDEFEHTAVMTDLVLGGLLGAGTSKFFKMQDAKMQAKIDEFAKKTMEAKTEDVDAAMHMNEALHREEGPGYHTSPESLRNQGDGIAMTMEQVFGEGKDANSITLPDNVRKLDVIPDPMQDVMRQSQAEAIAKVSDDEVMGVMNDAMKAQQEVAKAKETVEQKAKEVTEKLDETQKKIETAENDKAFSTQQVEQIIARRPGMQLAEGVSAEKFMESAKEQLEADAKMGRLHNVAIACAMTRGV